MNDPDSIELLEQTIRANAKYAHVDEKLVRMLIASESTHQRSSKEIVKAVRNKIHQVGGSYIENPIPFDRLHQQIEALPADLRDSAVQAFCQTTMQLHTSTRERLPILSTFYAQALAGLGPFQSLMDLACGLNPLTYSWLSLAPQAEIFACDIYSDIVSFLNAFFQHMHLAGKASVCNLIEQVPARPVQLALLLKTIPCLEQLDKLIGQRLLENIQAEVLLVSFPAHSLGGRGKGMRSNYAAHFEQLYAGLPWHVRRFDFPTELVYRLERA